MNVAINYTLESIAEITGGKIVQHNSAIQPEHLLLDSRKVIFPETTIFFSSQHGRRNAQSFIDDLYKKKVQNFLVDKKIYYSSYPSANFILVHDTFKALQNLAIHHRNKFNIPVIGITGSNGKTVVKEWLNQLLESDFNIARSPKSYNSQVGVPLSILQMHEQHTLGIFEAGISQPGEMEALEKIIRPGIGIITNIGEAHNAGFKNLKQKIGEKIKLFVHAYALTFSTDVEDLVKAITSFEKKHDHLKKFTWSKKYDGTLKIISVNKEAGRSLIKAFYKDEQIEIEIPFTDEASIENAISCWCILLQFNIADEIISERFKRLQQVEMRLELKQGINSCSIINDSYSADISSLSIALDFLLQQKQHKKYTVILSDILQSGKSEKQLYNEVAALLLQKNIERLIAIGPQIKANQNQFSFFKEKDFFVSVDNFKKNFYALHFGNENILIKGARIFEFEQINQLLEQKIHQTVLTINLNAIAHNLKQYRQLLRPATKIMAMVKAFSYGSGSYQVANLLQFHKVDYLAVAYADEGVELRKAGITLPIMVINPEENTYNALLQYNLEPEIFSFSMLHSFEKYIQSSAIDYFPVHIKLDTGMHRLGFEKKDITALGKHLQNYKRLKVQSVFSHLAASENHKHDDYTLQQAEIFLQCCNEFEQIIGYGFFKHILNTSGISRHTGLQMDMVRLGIGLYGVENDPFMQSLLQNVTTLSTTIAQVKKVQAGETIGYGRKGKVEKDSDIATVRIGYADGYSRKLGNGKGKMLIQNNLAPVIGNICMDMTMLDITGMRNINEGDEVIVFGEGLPIKNLAHWSETISYEIMTSISPRVKRIYFEE